MLTLLTILLLLAAVSAYFYFSSCDRNGERELSPADVDHSNLRPLFQPTDAELREMENENQRLLTALEAEKEDAAKLEKSADFQQRLSEWIANPKRSKIAHLLNEAVFDPDLFADAAETIFETWQAGQVQILTADDLAHLLASHFWLIPANNRTPSVSFRVQRLLSSLRLGSPLQNAGSFGLR